MVDIATPVNLLSGFPDADTARLDALQSRLQAARANVETLTQDSEDQRLDAAQARLNAIQEKLRELGGGAAGSIEVPSANTAITGALDDQTARLDALETRLQNAARDIQTLSNAEGGMTGEVFSKNPMVTINDTTVAAASYSPNTLNEYHNVSYAIRLVAVAGLPTTYDAYMALRDTDRMVVIAETGSSRYGIDSLHISNLVGETHRTSNLGVKETKMEITISEANGISLLDSIRNACEVLQIPNYATAPFYLEVRFHGYSDNGQPVDRIGFSEDPDILDTSGRRKYGFLLYAVNFTTFEMDVTTGGGARYTIGMIPVNESVNDALSWRSSNPISLSGRTFDECRLALEKSLNDDVRFRYFGAELDRYEIISHDRELNQAIMQGDGERGTEIFSPSVQFGKGESITNMLISLILNSSIAGKYKLYVDDAKKADAVMQIWRIYPEVSYTGEYDYSLNRYHRRIRINIMPYRTVMPVLNQQHLQAINSSDTVLELKRRNFLKKRYHYTFSGLNTEVINFDLRMNFNWGSLTQVYEGVYRGFETVAHGQVYDENIVKRVAALNARANQLSESTRAAEEALRGLGENPGETDDRLTDLHIQLNEAKRREAELADLRDRISGTIDYSDRITTKTGVKGDVSAQSVERYETAIKEQQQKIRDLQNAAGQYQASRIAGNRYATYAEDIDRASVIYPISFLRNPRDTTTQYGSGNPGGRDIGKSVLSTIYEQLHGVVSSSLQTSTMEIRGDVYWFGLTSMDALTPEGADVARSSAAFPNYDIGDHYVVVIFRYPTGSTDNGMLNFTDSGMMNGVYRIVSVDHSFSNGSFTQSLRMQRVTALINGDFQ